MIGSAAMLLSASIAKAGIFSSSNGPVLAHGVLIRSLVPGVAAVPEPSTGRGAASGCGSRPRRCAPRLMRSGRETIAEHRQAANGFRFGRLVLKNVPVLGELAVFEAHDIGGDP
jgi:hypothetical protein